MIQIQIGNGFIPGLAAAFLLLTRREDMRERAASFERGSSWHHMRERLPLSMSQRREEENNNGEETKNDGRRRRGWRRQGRSQRRMPDQ